MAQAKCQVVDDILKTFAGLPPESIVPRLPENYPLSLNLFFAPEAIFKFSPPPLTPKLGNCPTKLFSRDWTIRAYHTKKKLSK